MSCYFTKLNVVCADLDCKITDEKDLGKIKPVLYLSTNPQDMKNAITAGDTSSFFIYFFNYILFFQL